MNIGLLFYLKYDSNAHFMIKNPCFLITEFKYNFSCLAAIANSGYSISPSFYGIKELRIVVFNELRQSFELGDRFFK